MPMGPSNIEEKKSLFQPPSLRSVSIKQSTNVRTVKVPLGLCMCWVFASVCFECGDTPNAVAKSSFFIAIIMSTLYVLGYR